MAELKLAPWGASLRFGQSESGRSGQKPSLVSFFVFLFFRFDVFLVFPGPFWGDMVSWEFKGNPPRANRRFESLVPFTKVFSWTLGASF